ncbi:helix-turn-helix domain-containing protein [Sphingomonas sp. 22176]|uniref:helix-turn-helix domain-containing protein n=1 Tax=Sphingomonas sp. 22176 TaxID=3453884 RepID=UPI003F847DAD
MAALASVAGMSRTSFVERFRDVVGQTPLDYLTGWRMRLAADCLRRTADIVAELGFSIAYAN